MDSLVINGGRRLEGRVRASGAKNSALPIIASSLLGGELDLDNVPDLKDVSTICQLLRDIGGRIDADGNSLHLEFKQLDTCKVIYDLVRTMRASVLVLGPMLARFGEAMVSLPGGCSIGARPINIHIDGLKKMGAEIKLEHGYVHARAAKLRGAHLNLDFPTVTGTENLMMAAVMAEGETVIENAASEPEIADLAESLNSRGARISGAGTGKIIIEGVTALGAGRHTVMPDRIEVGTFLVAAAATRGDVTVEACAPRYLESLILKLREAGVDITVTDNSARAAISGRPRRFDLVTMPYPGFPTDMQAQMMSLATIADGASTFKETIFESRMLHVAELKRMGASILVQGSNAVVNGVGKLAGARVMASDLRASASLVIAGLMAEDSTCISRIYHLDRGYDDIEGKLSGLGADIKREKE